MSDCWRVDKNVLGLKLDNTFAINSKRVGLGRISVIHVTEQSKHKGAQICLISLLSEKQIFLHVYNEIQSKWHNLAVFIM